MRRSSITLTLALLSLAGCASPEAPTSVITGLAADRPIAELDQDEAYQACEGYLAYASTAFGGDGPLGIGCRIQAAFNTDDAASCELAYTACLADHPSLDTFCETYARPVPDCDRSVTVDRYESCMTSHIDQGAAIDFDCSLADRDDEIRARLSAWSLSAECAFLGTRECFFPAPIEPLEPL